MKYDGVGPDWVDKVNIAALISIMLYSCCCSMMKGQTQTLIDSSNFMRFLYDSSDWHQSTLNERVLKWCWIVFIWQNVLIFLWWIRGHGSYLVRKNKELKCCCSDLMQHHVFPVAYLVTRLYSELMHTGLQKWCFQWVTLLLPTKYHWIHCPISVHPDPELSLCL